MLHVRPRVELDESPLNWKLRGSLCQSACPFNLEVCNTLQIHLIVCSCLRRIPSIQGEALLLRHEIDQEYLLLRLVRRRKHLRRLPQAGTSYEWHEDRQGEDGRWAMRHCTHGVDRRQDRGRWRRAFRLLILQLLEPVHRPSKLLASQETPQLLVKALAYSSLQGPIWRLSARHCCSQQDLLQAGIREAAPPRGSLAFTGVQRHRRAGQLLHSQAHGRGFLCPRNHSRALRG
mmetsp:Transcript_39091/g.72844  ORF Transcript_39091/g.72844 Transcript_39091/m.72844 type:complete len:232 (-) Transcript_39091:7-702(-)